MPTLNIQQLKYKKMNRITELFARKEKNILSVYFTAGFPKLDDTTKIIKLLEKAGVDLIEIGIPFSDPLADGLVIQESSSIALGNGMSLNLLFEQLKDIRQEVKIPLILMGYLNPVYQYGVKEFCEKCATIGIDGVILPDLPLEDYKEVYVKYFEENKLSNIFLISPQTVDKRIRQIDEISKGFIYMVSSSSTTGTKTSIANEQLEYFARIKNMKLKNPQIIGFGISNKETFDTACEYANGAIIGSAFIKALNKEGNLEDNITNFVDDIRQ